MTKWILSVCLAFSMIFGVTVVCADEPSPDYSITKNSRINVLSSVTLSISRRSTTNLFLLCIDGYQFIMAAQNSGVTLEQILGPNNTVQLCDKRDRD